MALFLSEPFEELRASTQRSFHTIIVGSGYGAAFTALALALRPDKPYANSGILVIERGREFLPGDFPRTLSDLPGHVSVQANGKRRWGNADALFDLRKGENATVLVGQGLGGTSLINAGVAVDPDAQALAGLPAPPDGRSWLERLAPSLRFARQLLRVGPHPRGATLPKFAALHRLAGALGAEHRLADIAVNFEPGSNPAGIHQAACNDCGNCFTGCNIGAKNTLAVNVWPILQALGVRIITGGTVRRIRQGDAAHPWQVMVTGTSDGASSEEASEPEETLLRCQRVVLAAGALGSTEILWRSARPAPGAPSLPAPPRSASGKPRQGRPFTLNGDGIAFGYGQRAPVHAFASVPSAAGITPPSGPGPGQAPGPTIVSMMRLGGEGRSALVEDATIPLSIARGVGEILASASLLRRYTGSKPTAWHRLHPEVDPLAMPDGLLEHHQPLLLMGTEPSSAGELRFDPALDHLTLHWPGPLQDAGGSAVSWLHGQFSKVGKEGFDGGHYMPSPLWRPLPPGSESVFEGGEELGGLHLCVHPLGGCGMGSSMADGMVGTDGQVFDGAGSVHRGLYVLDGSILPAAPGINPFMTIAALAHDLALRMDGPVYAGAYDIPRPGQRPPPPQRTGPPLQWPPRKLPFQFQERLYGPASAAQAQGIGEVLGMKLGSEHSLALDIRMDFGADIDQWLADPGSRLSSRFALHRIHEPGTIIDTVPDTLLALPALAASEAGGVWLFARDRRFFRPWRAGLAIWRFLALRGEELIGGIAGKAGKNPLRLLADFLRVAVEHGHWRYLRYDCTVEIGGQRVRVHGVKRLAYDGSRSRALRDEANPWSTLANIELTFHNLDTGGKASGWFHVDLLRMTAGALPLQCQARGETPRVAEAAGRFGALAARALVHTHLWSFGAPSYERFPTFEQWARTPAGARTWGIFEFPSHIRCAGNGRPRKVPLSQVPLPAGPEYRNWRLLQAGEFAPGSRVAFLVHGVSHSSRIYYTDTLEQNFAGHLLDAGYSIYLLDHGLSTALDLPADYRPTVVDVAQQVTTALAHASKCLEARGHGGRLQVFAHCIGSAATAMSILRDGPLRNSRGETVIESLAMHAVPPWIRASETNVLRGYLGAAFRANFFPDVIDPIPWRKQDEGSAGGMGGTLLDRLGNSVPWTREEMHDHDHADAWGRFSRTICNRMTLFYGYDWAHHNFNRETHSALHLLMGPVNSEAYRDLYFLVRRGRLTDGDGRNAFLNEEWVRERWIFPTVFLHGNLNETFNEDSSRLSARLLARIRRHHRQDIATRFEPLPGYGHLDAIIGAHASRDVFPKVTAFFAHPAAGADPKPRASTDTLKVVATGPIISRPRRIDGVPCLRIWAETTEFQTSAVVNLKLHDAHGCELPRQGEWIRGAPARRSAILGLSQHVGQRAEAQPNSLKSSMFWLGDFRCAQFASPARLTVQSSGAGASLEDRQGMRFAAGDGTPGHGVDPLDDPPLGWAELPWFRRFLEGSHDGKLRFVLGSCWYPGSWFDQDISDATFALLKPLITGEPGVDHLLLVGDQIYADASSGLFDIAEDRERLQESYRRAFRSPQARWVLANLPTYFAVDDHEFRDGYPWRAAHENRPGGIGSVDALGEVARMEAWNFQMHHGGRGPVAADRRDNGLWYDFQSAGHDFFVFDTRSERRVARQGDLQDLLSACQQAGFEAWMRQVSGGDGPLFLVTGSPLAPMPLDEIAHPHLGGGSDTLRAYPRFLQWLLELACRFTPHRPLVLLSGDPHFSSACQFTLDNGRQSIRGTAIISSGMNCSLPFANARPDEYDWAGGTLRFADSPLQLSTSGARLLSTSPGHALIVTASRDNGSWQVKVQVVDGTEGQPEVRVFP